MCVNTWREAVKKPEPGSPQWCPARGTGAVGTQEAPSEAMEELLCCGGEPGQVAQGDCGVRTVRDVQKLLGHGPGQQALPCQAGWAR